MNSIFICYRRDDSADIVGRIYDYLLPKFGKTQVVRDVDSIPLGVDYRTHIEKSIENCNVALIVIGRKWLDIADQNGNRRLDNPADLTRVEIELCLSKDITVIPVLVSGATMPKEEDLPESIRQLVYQNSVVVRADPDFKRDIEKLINSLSGRITTKKNTKFAWFALSGLLLVIISGYWWFASQSTIKEPTDQLSTQETQSRFFGALDGIYEGDGKNVSTQLTIKAASNELELLTGNCAFYGVISEADSYWSVIAKGQDGMCDMVDTPFIEKEVGRITPVKGQLANSGKVLKALVNFNIGSLSQYSGIYEFKYNDLEDLRRAKGFDKKN